MRSRSAQLRRHCPVMHSTSCGGFWVVSPHKDVVNTYRDHRTFSSAAGVAIPGLGFEVSAIPTESDEPEHQHYRRVLWPFLTPEAVVKYEPTVRATVTELVNEFVETGRADIME